MFNIDIIFFYLAAGYLIWAAFYISSGQLLKSIVFTILIIFVGSEFWEIPIFLMGYLGVPGYWFPHVVHHVLISVMAALLIWLSKFKVNVWAGLILSGDLILNFVFLLIFPGAVSSWILRSLSLASLSTVFLWSVNKNEKT